MTKRDTIATEKEVELRERGCMRGEETIEESIVTQNVSQMGFDLDSVS
jgi:hypothetical protein